MDGTAAVAVVPPQIIYEDFADAILSYCKPKYIACPKSLTIIFVIYNYNNNLITQSRPIKRGQPNGLYYRRGKKNVKTRGLQQVFEQWTKERRASKSYYQLL